LRIYDGSNTSSPLIGTYHGNLGASIGTITSSTGCLTFHFTSDGSIVRSGWVANISCVPCPIPPDCEWLICLEDDYGDGWNSGVVEVFINGLSIGGATLSSGYGPQCYIIPINIGDDIFIDYTAGSWSYENEWYLYNPAGTLVASGGVGGTTPGDYTHTNAQCPITDPQQGQDCGWAPTICNNEQISGNSSGSGNVDELDALNRGCLLWENQSQWFFFQAQTSGWIEFTISPSSDDDYDFAIWEGINCPPITQPIRCSWAAGAGLNGSHDTGIMIGNPEGDDSEGVSGDNWVNAIYANAGDEFTLLIDNWFSTSNPYTLTWNLPDGASLDCTPLPIILSKFKGECVNNIKTITWETSFEFNTSYYILETSNDAQNYYPIIELDAVGYSSITTGYKFEDNITNYPIVYYRLKQVDINNDYVYYGPITLDCGLISNILISPNPIKSGDVLSIGNAKIIKVYDIVGRLVKYTTENSFNCDLKAGTYLINIDNTLMFKLLVE